MKKILVLILIFLIAVPSVRTLHADDDTPKDFDNGFKVALEILKEMGIEEDTKDAEQLQRIDNIAYRVAQRSDPDKTNYSFHIVKMEEPNAFALPGGFIFITTGMLDLDLTDDELAALLGHEITHVRNEHSHKAAKRQTIMNLLYQALVLGIAFGLKDNNQGYDPVTGMPTRSAKSEVLQGSAAFGMIFQELLLRGFSRELELEADREGMIAASRAGFNPQGTNQLFEKMRKHIYEAPGFGYWRTHPYLDDRAEIARSLSATLSAAKNPADATDYRLKTQQTFVKLIDKRKEENDKAVLRKMALDAYGKGKTADELRSWFIHDAETKESNKEPFNRDYGKLVRMYEENLREMQAPTQLGIQLQVPGTTETIKSTPEKPNEDSAELRMKLEENLDKIKKDLSDAKPLYEEVLKKDMFDTDMLKRYLSNYPDSPRVSEVKYRLAENYRILKKNSDAVGLYLEVMNDKNGGEWAQQSHNSLLQLIPS
ncbi:MAG TPA: M48 family metallopeptidase, partial [Acidobacteriota bacterium]